MYDSTACMYVILLLFITLKMMLYCGGYKMYSNYCACIKTVLVFIIPCDNVLAIV